jgi:hypothetical protein
MNHLNHAYAEYGGRGITVHPDWLGRGGFRLFLEHMGERPEGMTLDRIDSNRGYEPGNVRWATRTEQQNNRRFTELYSLNGERRSLADWCRINGINRQTAWSRIHKRGWPPEQALTVPADKTNRAW